MGGGPIIIIDPKKPQRVKSPLSKKDTVAALREAIKALKSGAAQIEPQAEAE